MTGPYAFIFDSSACTGCKACQAACKDKNHLPLGVLWRRVYEISGGGWMQKEGAWTSTVFAYHLSMACNHCVHPKCAGVCPVDAFTVRPDGIVLIDAGRCIGCKYCSWACPYGALQFDRFQGIMTKCDLCFDNLDAGIPPACVAACPMRVLDLADPAESEKRAVPYQAVYPMPRNSRTEPRYFVKPHPAAKKPDLGIHLANREETTPPKAHPPGWEEAPLVAFTLLVQMAVGALWASLWIFQPLAVLSGQIAYRLLPLLVLGIVGLFLILGGLASFAHLGRKRNAWKSLKHLRKSWLSREILFCLLFGTGWAASTLMALMGKTPSTLTWATAILGIGLVYSMAQVYSLRSVPEWNSWRTLVGFLISAGLLGHTAMAALLATEARITGMDLPIPRLAWIGTIPALFLLAQAALMLSAVPKVMSGINRTRIGLILAALAALAAGIVLPAAGRVEASLVVFVLALVEECLGRWQFYARRNPAL
ncbi:MAG: DmsC/YnfH family molybdoenzyme membrane anchor subunit [Anaerolineales bacterium]|jgi:anaerobic dimethyl sulfoxide reductase subunit B (iron-sulfur subunit)